MRMFIVIIAVRASGSLISTRACSLLFVTGQPERFHRYIRSLSVAMELNPAYQQFSKRMICTHGRLQLKRRVSSE